MQIPTITELESKLQPDFQHGGYTLKDDIFFKVFSIDMILPRGLSSDGLSLPWFLTLFIKKTDPRFLFASIVHDMVYRTQFLPRLIGDALMKEILKAQGYRVAPIIFYYPLRVFGFISWRSNQKKGLLKDESAMERLHKYTCRGKDIRKAVKNILK